MKCNETVTTQKQGGVYKITNSQNGRFYIGSTFRFYDRFRNHRNDLEAGRHLNTFLQNDFNKCGKEVFLCEILEVIPGGQVERLAAEQKLLDVYYDNQQQCYNLTPHANETREGKRQRKAGDPLVDKRFQSPSEDLLLKRGEAIRKAKDNPESKERARKNCQNGLWKDHVFECTLVNQNTGEEVKLAGSLRQFALERGLSYKALHLMTKGKTKSSGGWTVMR